MSGSRTCRAGVIALALACAAGTVAAQTANRDQEMVRRLRQQVQQLQAQQATAQAAQQAELQTARDAAASQKAALQALQAEQRRASQASAEREQRASAAEQALQTLQAERTALQQQFDLLQQRQRDTEASLVKARSEGDGLQTNLKRRELQLAELAERHLVQAQGLKQCIDNNQALQVLGRELLQRYVDKGLGETLATAEPFLQTRRVALENLVQGYEDKLDQLALKAATAQAAGRGTP
jgi:chromosome segregation ATPase